MNYKQIFYLLNCRAMKAKSQKRPTTMHQPASKKEKVNLLTDISIMKL